MAITTPIFKSDALDVEGTVDFQNGSIQLKFTGTIEERATLEQVTRHIFKLGPQIKNAIFDLRRVKAVNSAGVKRWITFIKEVSDRLNIVISDVSEIFLERASLFPEVLGKSGTKVLAFEAPFRCVGCSARVGVTIQSKDVKKIGKTFELPAFECEQCHVLMKFDEFEENYLRFLSKS